ncbi:hypothetical protein G3480_00365 [Thiorhodococcus mannitoliphagus]|uniref:Sulfur globule protein CV3 n=1 Tax=Thiorhodococcus mannitoliphagus TaxID=329406 RepID=A0A6P1DLI8_9GAMM|nr:hypothetical protein [Thiorhodococcus mannitoliphagus]NEX18789.1 hypothetical protein [Thiorhodococcus mannitoliphagus]
MKRSHVFLSALLATLLLAIPAQSQAFCGFFGGGFGLGFGGGWSGWGGPGWWGGYPGDWGGPAYWHQPYQFWRRPYLWHGYRSWGNPFLGPRLAYGYAPEVVAPAAKAPETAKEK